MGLFDNTRAFGLIGLLDDIKENAEAARYYACENPVKTTVIVTTTIVTGGAALAAAPMIASIAGATGVLGAASTGTAISSLSGAALTNASLAALGGGAISVGGMGMAGGTVAIATTGSVLGMAGGTVAVAAIDSEEGTNTRSSTATVTNTRHLSLGSQVSDSMAWSFFMDD